MYIYIHVDLHVVMFIIILSGPPSTSGAALNVVGGVVSPTAQVSQPKSSSSPSAEQATSRNGTSSSNNNINSAHVIVIKWKDDQGKTQRYRLIDKIRQKWQDIGKLVRIPLDELNSLSDKHKKDAAECCRAVLDTWMEAPPPGYPVTWEGLIELLEDVDLGEVVTELKTVLHKANIII